MNEVVGFLMIGLVVAVYLGLGQCLSRWDTWRM